MLQDQSNTVFEAPAPIQLSKTSIPLFLAHAGLSISGT